MCDTIVAVDGAYALLPGARPRSHPDQADAIMAACEAAGVGCVVHRPKEVWWGNEVEKRQHTVELARAVKPDWLLVFDADYLVMLIDDPAFTRSLLENTDKHVATYTILDGKDHLADEVMADYALKRPIDTEWTLRDRGIFRWTDDITYGPAHYTIRGTYDGDMRWLRGPDLAAGQQHLALEPEHLGRNLVVVHRHQKRALVRQKAAEGYYHQRDEMGIEKINDQTLYA